MEPIDMQRVTPPRFYSRFFLAKKRENSMVVTVETGVS